MRLFIKIVTTALLSTTLAGTVMASADLTDPAVLSDDAKPCNMRAVLGINSEDGEEYKISLNVNFVTSLLRVDTTRFSSRRTKNVLDGLKGLCADLTTAAEGTDKLKAKLRSMPLAATLMLDATMPDANYRNSDNTAVIRELTAAVSDPFFLFLKLNNVYGRLQTLKARSVDCGAGSADSSGYASLQEIITVLDALDERRKSLASDSDIASITAEYKVLFNKAEKFRGGSKNKDLGALHEKYVKPVPRAKYEAMRAGLIGRAKAYGAIILVEEDGVAAASNIVLKDMYNAKKAELKALVRRLEGYTSNGYKVTSEPIPEKDVKSICSGCSRGRKYFTKNPDLTAGVESHSATSDDSASSSALDPWLDVD